MEETRGGYRMVILFFSRLIHYFSWRHLFEWEGGYELLSISEIFGNFSPKNGAVVEETEKTFPRWGAKRGKGKENERWLGSTGDLWILFLWNIHSVAISVISTAVGRHNLKRSLLVV